MRVVEVGMTAAIGGCATTTRLRLGFATGANVEGLEARAEDVLATEGKDPDVTVRLSCLGSCGVKERWSARDEEQEAEDEERLTVSPIGDPDPRT